MSESELQTLFKSMLIYIGKTHGVWLDVTLVIDHAGSYPKTRDYARTSGRVVFVSPKILKASLSRIQGLLYHEIGHVLLMQEAEDFEHSERQADYIAELCFNTPIYYDIEGVQTIQEGERPRPPHLPQ